jgi:hypothetical protein
MADRKLNLRYSADGGANWGDWRILDLGEVGDFIKNLEENRFGQGEEWIFEVMIASNFKCDLLDASWKPEMRR